MPVPKPRNLLVHANPFHALDAYGRVGCGVPTEKRVGAPNQRTWIGAKPTAELVGERRQPGDGHYDVHDITWTYDLAPIEVPDTNYYRERLRHGELIPGDAFTAARGSYGEKRLTFKPVAEVLSAEQAATCEAWAKEHFDVKAPALDLDVDEMLTKHAEAAKKVVEDEAAFVREHAVKAEAAKKAADDANITAAQPTRAAEGT